MKDYSGTTYNGNSYVRELRSETSAKGHKRRVALWKCECEKEFKASIGNATSGQVKSCGCKKIAAQSKRCFKHGFSPDKNAKRLYRFWQSMKDRCNNSKSYNYKNYGGRGIKCYWSESFSSFLEYFENAFGTSEIPEKMSMDRIDNNGNYAPGNLRFASMRTQANNKRNNRIINYGGKDITLSELSRLTGIKRGTLWSRLTLQGKTVAEAVKNKL